MGYFLIILCIINVGANPCVRPPNVEVSVKIRRGDSFSEVSSKLCSADVIEHPFWFRVWAKMRGSERKIKAGYYIFKKPTSIWETLRILTLGKSIEVKVIIPEGATLNDIAEMLFQEIDMDKEKFLCLTNDITYVRKLKIQSTSLEGYLFPETYLIPYAEEPEEIISRMVNQFFHVFTPELKQRAKELGFTMEEAVTLASLVEKEAAREEEKPIISGVYHKRLNKGLLLQCDATIQYSLPRRKPRLSYEDLKIPSKYNTYLNKGLPPTPIASPGKGSIIAALWPKDTGYLYFVARGDRTHIFSKTLTQHNIEKLKVKK